MNNEQCLYIVKRCIPYVKHLQVKNFRQKGNAHEAYIVYLVGKLKYFHPKVFPTHVFIRPAKPSTLPALAHSLYRVFSLPGRFLESLPTYYLPPTCTLCFLMFSYLTFTTILYRAFSNVMLFNIHNALSQAGTVVAHRLRCLLEMLMTD